MGTVALGIRHVLCTPLRLVRYIEKGEQEMLDRVIGVLYLDSRERGALRSATVAGRARDAERRSGDRHRERPPLSRGARQGEDRAGAEGGGGDPAVAAARRARTTARSSRPRRPRCPAGRSAATSSTTSISRRRHRDSSSAMCGQGVAGGAAGGGRARNVQRRSVPTRPAPRRQSRASTPGIFGARSQATFLTAFYGILVPRRLARLHERRTQPADSAL